MGVLRREVVGVESRARALRVARAEVRDRGGAGGDLGVAVEAVVAIMIITEEEKVAVIKEVVKEAEGTRSLMDAKQFG